MSFFKKLESIFIEYRILVAAIAFLAAIGFLISSLIVKDKYDDVKAINFASYLMEETDPSSCDSIVEGLYSYLDSSSGRKSDAIVLVFLADRMTKLNNYQEAAALLNKAKGLFNIDDSMRNIFLIKECFLFINDISYSQEEFREKVEAIDETDFVKAIMLKCSGDIEKAREKAQKALDKEKCFQRRMLLIDILS